MENTPSVTISLKHAPAASASLSFAKANAVDDAGVIKLVADDRVVFTQQRFEQAAVGIEATRIEDRIFHPKEDAQCALEFLVHRLRAADESHRCQAVAVAVEALACGSHQARIVGKAQIVVGAEV